jgi:hypothetical protein
MVVCLFRPHGELKAGLVLSWAPSRNASPGLAGTLSNSHPHWDIGPTSHRLIVFVRSMVIRRAPTERCETGCCCWKSLLRLACHVPQSSPIIPALPCRYPWTGSSQRSLRTQPRERNTIPTLVPLSPRFMPCQCSRRKQNCREERSATEEDNLLQGPMRRQPGEPKACLETFALLVRTDLIDQWIFSPPFSSLTTRLTTRPLCPPRLLAKQLQSKRK